MGSRNGAFRHGGETLEAVAARAAAAALVRAWREFQRSLAEGETRVFRACDAPRWRDHLVDS